MVFLSSGACIKEGILMFRLATSGRERARKRLASAWLEKAAARGRAAVRGASAAVVVATARLTCEKERLDRELGRVKHFLGVWQAQPSRKPRARDDVLGVLTCPRRKSTIQVSCRCACICSVIGKTADLQRSLKRGWAWPSL